MGSKINLSWVVMSEWPSWLKPALIIGAVVVALVVIIVIIVVLIPAPAVSSSLVASSAASSTSSSSSSSSSSAPTMFWPVSGSIYGIRAVGDTSPGYLGVPTNTLTVESAEDGPLTNWTFTYLGTGATSSERIYLIVNVSSGLALSSASGSFVAAVNALDGRQQWGLSYTSGSANSDTVQVFRNFFNNEYLNFVALGTTVSLVGTLTSSSNLLWEVK